MSRHKRRHKHRRMQQQSHPAPVSQEELLEDLREDNLRFALRELNLTLPWQFASWPRYFLSRTSFLDAFDQWMAAQIERPGHVRIIDDVDRKLMKLGPNPDFAPRGTDSTTNDNPWLGWGRSDEDWDDARYGGSGSKWMPATLPLTPVIEAPTGLCGVAHHVT